jgi:hypothetical protein
MSSRRCLRTRRETSIKERSLVGHSLRAASATDRGQAVPGGALLRLSCRPTQASAPSQHSPRRCAFCHCQAAATGSSGFRAVQLAQHLRSGRVESVHRSTSARARPNPSLKVDPLRQAPLGRTAALGASSQSGQAVLASAVHLSSNVRPRIPHQRQLHLSQYKGPAHESIRALLPNLGRPCMGCEIAPKHHLRSTCPSYWWLYRWSRRLAGAHSVLLHTEPTTAADRACSPAGIRNAWFWFYRRLSRRTRTRTGASIRLQLAGTWQPCGREARTSCKAIAVQWHQRHQRRGLTPRST